MRTEQLCAACEAPHPTEPDVVCPVDPPDLVELHAGEVRRLDLQLARSRAELDVVRAELAVRTRERDSWEAAYTYLLEGLACCAACGEPIRIRSSCGARRRPNPAAYVCRGRQRGTCAAPIVRTGETDDRVWAAIAAALLRADLAERMARLQRDRAADAHDWSIDLATARAHLARLARVEAAILVRYRRGQVSQAALDVELAAGGRERRAVEAQVEAAERAIMASHGAAASLDGLGPLLERLRADLVDPAGAPPVLRRALLRRLVEPGDAILRAGVVELVLVLQAVAAPIDLVGRAGTRTPHETDLRIRVVA